MIHTDEQVVPLPARTFAVHRWWASTSRYWPVVVGYLLITWFTGAYFIGDTIWYTNDIVAGEIARDSGHLLWRPLGWLMWQAFLPLTSAIVGPNLQATAVLTLLGINWLAGLVVVLTLHTILSKICTKEWAITLAVFACICTQGLLNYAQSGAAYIPGLALLMIGMNLLMPSRSSAAPSLRTPIFAGVFLAGAVCIWLPYVLAVPAVLVTPLFLSGFDRPRWKLVFGAGVTCAAVCGGLYLLAALNLGITSIGGFRRWLGNASHGITIGGVPRMALGFPRSFVTMGDDGVLFKRFLVHDPYNPVSLTDLFRISLWKIALFYLLLAAIIANLLRSAQGRKICGLLAFSGLTVLGFAVYWQGGDMERYLALYPFFFLALAFALEQQPRLPVLRSVAGLFIAVEIISNIGVMSTWQLERQQAQTIARSSEVLAALKPTSVVVTLNRQDDLFEFDNTFVLHPVFRQHGEFTYALGRQNWQSGFATQALTTWAADGDVWLSRRLLATRPQAAWLWVEGDDQRALWKNINGFFTQLQTGRSVDGDDGFVLLERSPANQALLEAAAKKR